MTYFAVKKCIKCRCLVMRRGETHLLAAVGRVIMRQVMDEGAAPPPQKKGG